jgi:hypothetical protein
MTTFLLKRRGLVGHSEASRQKVDPRSFVKRLACARKPVAMRCSPITTRRIIYTSTTHSRLQLCPKTCTILQINYGLTVLQSIFWFVQI